MQSTPPLLNMDHKEIDDVAVDAALPIWAAMTQLSYLHTVETGASSWTTARTSLRMKGFIRGY